MTPTDLERGMSLAAEWLARRDWFAEEVRARLETAGIADPSAVVARLCELNLLDDDRVAAEDARRYGEKLWSNARIAERLRSRGAGEDAVSNALSSLEPEASRAAHAIAGAHWTGKGAAKAARYLTGQGYEEDAVRAAVERRFRGADA